MEKFSKIVNDRIMYLMTFVGKETVDIELLNYFIDTLSTNNDCDIQLDRYDIKWILKGSKRAEIIAVQDQREHAAFSAMEKVLSSLSDSDREFFGAIIHFRIHPKYPFIQLSNAMTLLRYASRNDNITFGSTTDEALPLNFVRITIITVDTSAKK